MAGNWIARFKMKRTKFIDRVINIMRKQRWHVDRVSGGVVDLYCTRGDHYRTGVRVKSHGRIYDKEWEALRQYGINNNVHVLYVHETYEHEIAFVKVYPKEVSCIAV